MKSTYFEDIVLRNNDWIKIGIFLLIITHFIYILNLLFLSAGLTTLNNQIYGAFYFSIIIFCIIALILLKVFESNSKKLYSLQCSFAMLAMLWGLLFSSYQLYKNHSDKMLLFSVMLLACVIFIRLQSKDFFPILSIITILTFWVNYPQLTSALIVEILGILILVSAIPLMFYFQDVKQYTTLYALQQAKLDLQEQRNNAVSAMMREKHDQRHHNNILSELIRAGKTEEFFSYIQLQNDTIEKGSMPYCKNTYVNSVLKTFVTMATNKNIQLTIEASVPDEINISPLDLTTIYSNLLENAVHGCEQSLSTKKEIHLITHILKRKMLIIRVSNSSRTDVCFNSKGVPQSQNKVGIGVTSVISIANRYKGMANFTLVQDTFTAKVVLNCQ